jgi:hypothetical protein
MWIVEPIEAFDWLLPTNQFWLIALAVEENGGPAEYAHALRTLAEHLDELGCGGSWLLPPERVA